MLKKKKKFVWVRLYSFIFHDTGIVQLANYSIVYSLNLLQSFFVGMSLAGSFGGSPEKGREGKDRIGSLIIIEQKRAKQIKA